MTKAELVALVASTLVVGKPVTQDMVDTLTAAVGPKSKGAAAYNIADITKVENGKTVANLDTVAKVWLPATADFFYEEKEANRQKPELNNLKTHSKAREKLGKEHVKLKKRAKDVIWNGTVLGDYITKEESSDLLASVPKVRYDRVVPYGQEKAGSIKGDPAVVAFEEKCGKLEGKGKTKADPKDAEAKPNTPKA